MAKKYRCDTCEEPYPENKLIRIRALKTIWFRCKKCQEKYISGVKLGNKPRDDWYYAHLQTKHIFGGFENPDNIIRFNP